jgi:hypothetical protein
VLSQGTADARLVEVEDDDHRALRIIEADLERT